ncbi:MAG: DUF2141 domain-containing protein [Planctomycetota bacterium]
MAVLIALAAGLGLIRMLWPDRQLATKSSDAVATAVAAAPAPPVAPTDQVVVVRVSGLGSKSAAVMVAVFLGADGFPDVKAAASRAEKTGDSDLLEVELKLPLSGMAAVAVFQDLDGNGVLTKNVIGLPMEPYGFSRNARAAFGPPGFDSAAFDLATLTEPLQIPVR